MTRLLIVGPPGAGKGTQSARLTKRYGIPAIATGDIFRENIANGTDLGLRIKAIVDAGDYVPDSLTNELVADRLSSDDCADGFLLDGYPRTLEQVAFLDELLAARGVALDAVVDLQVDTDEVVTRLKKRAIEQGRSDDSEAAIRHRQSVFAQQTAPILAVYAQRGLLVPVDALGDVDEVTARIVHALEARGIASSRS